MDVAYFCRSRAASPIDLTRTISLTLSGSACLVEAVLFALGGAAVLAQRVLDTRTAPLYAFINAVLPFVAVVLALGTLSLLLAPPVVDLVKTWARWRRVRPLWTHLVGIRPDVHLEVAAAGGLRARLHTRLHRAVIETHDALRVTPVAVPPSPNISIKSRSSRHPRSRRSWPTRSLTKTWLTC